MVYKLRHAVDGEMMVVSLVAVCQYNTSMKNIYTYIHIEIPALYIYIAIYIRNYVKSSVPNQSEGRFQQRRI